MTLISHVAENFWFRKCDFPLWFNSVEMEYKFMRKFSSTIVDCVSEDTPKSHTYSVKSIKIWVYFKNCQNESLAVYGCGCVCVCVQGYLPSDNSI